MLNWIGKYVSSIETLKGKGNRVQIEAYYPTDEPELTTAIGKSVADAFRKAVIKAGAK